MTHKKRYLYAAVIVVAVIGIGFAAGTFEGSDNNAKITSVKPTVNVIVPTLGQVAKLGEGDFNVNCASCHGKNAAGTGYGPPLVHRIYEPNHHADMAFKLAANRGVRSHHWNFGNMPAQPQVKDFELVRIVTYVRELQKANGIF